MTSLLTTALEENNEQLRREVDALKTDNTQLRTDNDAMKDEIIQLQAKQKDEIGQLTTLLDKMAVNNENQIQQINSLSSEISHIMTENKMLKKQHLKVSQNHINTSQYHLVISSTHLSYVCECSICMYVEIMKL